MGVTPAHTRSGVQPGSALSRAATPLGVRFVARLLLLTFLATPFLLAFVPWQQTVMCRGTVIAYAPVERMQVLTARVSGQVTTWHANIADNRLDKVAADYRRRYKEDFWINLPRLQLDMLARAIDTAGSAEALKVSHALHGMRFAGDTGEVVMRTEDHQLIAPNYIATFSAVGGVAKIDAEGTGLGWKTDLRYENKDVALPSTCRMEPPRG